MRKCDIAIEWYIKASGRVTPSAFTLRTITSAVSPVYEIIVFSPRSVPSEWKYHNHYIICVRAIAQSVSRRSHQLDSRLFSVKFMVDKVAVEKGFTLALRFCFLGIVSRVRHAFSYLKSNHIRKTSGRNPSNIWLTRQCFVVYRGILDITRILTDFFCSLCSCCVQCVAVNVLNVTTLRVSRWNGKDLERISCDSFQVFSRNLTAVTEKPTKVRISILKCPVRRENF